MMNKPAKITVRVITLSDVDDIVAYLPSNEANNAKRQLREKILFPKVDVYDSKVNKGREIEDEGQKEKVDSWHKDLRDLKTEAFKNVPDCVNKYRQDLGV